MQRMGGSPATAFHSAANKAMLWSALQNAGAFQDMAAGTERQVMSSIERRMGEAAAAGTTADLTSLNKTVLKAVLADIGRAAGAPGGGARRPTTAVERAFASKQAQISEMATGRQPKRIDFSDDLDAPMGGAMDRAMQEAVNRRTAQLDASRAQHAGTRQQAEGWLGVKQAEQERSTGGAVRQLKIGGTVPSAAVATVPSAAVATVPSAAVATVPSAAAPASDRRVHFETPVAPNAPAARGEAHRFLQGLKREAPEPSVLPAVLEQLSEIGHSLGRIAGALERHAEVVRDAARALPPSPHMPSPSPPSPLSAGSDPTEIDLAQSVSDADASDDS